MTDLVNASGTAQIPSDGASMRISMNTAGTCLQGTVQALLDDDGDARMAAAHKDVAIAEGARFAGAILEAYFSHYGHAPTERPAIRAAALDRVPTGLLYGCVQSGKTRAITLTSALLFDNGIRIIVVLTSNNVELVEQTAERLKLVDGVQFITSLEDDEERWERDVAHIRTYLGETGLLVVCQKERHHQQRLIAFLREINAGSLPAVVFDDEADQATPDTTQAARTAGRANAPMYGSTTYRLTLQNDNVREPGDSIVETLARSVFVQVTATPYALLLQHIQHPLRPKFTCLIEPGDGYLGGDWFFPPHFSDGEVAPPIIEVPALEANALAAGPLAVPPEMLRRAIAYFCVAAAAHELHTGTRSKYGYSFLCHTSSKRVDHSHLERLISVFLEQIGRDLERDVAGDVADAFDFALREIKKTAPGLFELLTYPQLKRWILRKLPLRAMRVINAESDSLSFTPGLNFLIGGNILGRGLTIKRLLVTYYMRSARSTQMDTMLQHARMFGYRQEHKSLIRVFLPRTSIERFVDIVQSEKYLRALIRSAPAGAIPVRVAQNLNATRRNILDTGSLDAYRGGSQIYPYEPEHAPGALNGLTERISATLVEKAFRGDIRHRDPVEIDWSLFADLVRSVRIRDSDESRWIADALVNVAHSLQRDESGGPGPLPLLWVRDTERRGPRLLTGVAGGDDPSSNNARFSDRLVLMMFLHSGSRDLGWSGVPFWFPTVLLPAQAGMFLFSATE
jgi:hypothetical protein